MRDAKKVIFDAMAIVDKTDIKKSGIKNCLEFARNFMDIIDKEASGFQEVGAILDLYDTDSLKNVTRKYHTKQFNVVHYNVTDSTRIAHLDKKKKSFWHGFKLKASSRNISVKNWSSN